LSNTQIFLKKIGKILKGERKQAGFKIPPEEKHE
jgi:hypothetical protein